MSHCDRDCVRRQGQMLDLWLKWFMFTLLAMLFAGEITVLLLIGESVGWWNFGLSSTGR